MFITQNDLLYVFNLDLNKKLYLQLRKTFNQATSLYNTNSVIVWYQQVVLTLKGTTVYIK